MKLECPVCHRPMLGPDERCDGSFTERDHPSLVKPVPADQPKGEDALKHAAELNAAAPEYPVGEKGGER